MAYQKPKLANNFTSVVNDGDVFSVEAVLSLYDELSPILSPRHRTYLSDLSEGRIDPDPLVHMEIFSHLVTIYGLHVVKWSLQSGTVTKDIGAVLGEVRQGNMATEAMKLKRKEGGENDDESEAAGPVQAKSASAYLKALD